MKRLLLSLLLALACGAPAAIETANILQFGSRMKIVTGGWTDFTNKAATASAGDWIIYPPGPLVHVLTNQISFLQNPGVNFEIYPDIVFGCSSDSTAKR